MRGSLTFRVISFATTCCSSIAAAIEFVNSVISVMVAGTTAKPLAASPARGLACEVKDLAKETARATEEMTEDHARLLDRVIANIAAQTNLLALNATESQSPQIFCMAGARCGVRAPGPRVLKWQ